jgi:thioredoxin 1
MRVATSRRFDRAQMRDGRGIGSAQGYGGRRCRLEWPDAVCNEQRRVNAMSKRIEAFCETFDREVLASELPVVVEFYAPHCEECEAIEPLLRRLAIRFTGRVRFVRVNVDAEPVLAARNLIDAVPTLMLFMRGSDVDDNIDFRTPGALEAELERAASEHPPVCTAV